ncbi:MAG: hypothetical protein SFW07_07530 [Gammaproteobacteria bacterium]|nr:hypothetical protein [Gammaproteobacteria bacterium]
MKEYLDAGTTIVGGFISLGEKIFSVTGIDTLGAAILSRGKKVVIYFAGGEPDVEIKKMIAEQPHVDEAKLDQFVSWGLIEISPEKAKWIKEMYLAYVYHTYPKAVKEKVIGAGEGIKEYLEELDSHSLPVDKATATIVHMRKREGDMCAVLWHAFLISHKLFEPTQKFVEAYVKAIKNGDLDASVTLKKAFVDALLEKGPVYVAIKEEEDLKEEKRKAKKELEEKERALEHNIAISAIDSRQKVASKNTEVHTAEMNEQAELKLAYIKHKKEKREKEWKGEDSSTAKKQAGDKSAKVDVGGKSQLFLLAPPKSGKKSAGKVRQLPSSPERHGQSK